jgi:hypothetical protein
VIYILASNIKQTFFQAACDLAQDIEYAESTLATLEKAKTAFQRVMLDVTTNDIDLEVKDTVADIARGLRSLQVFNKLCLMTGLLTNAYIFKVPKHEIKAFRNASTQHRDYAFKIAFDLSFASDVLGSIGQEISAILRSSNLETLKTTHDYFLEHELELNKFYPLFTNNLNFNNEESIVLKSLDGRVSLIIMY